VQPSLNTTDWQGWPLLQVIEVIGEHFPYDGRFLDCPHESDCLRLVGPQEIYAGQFGVYDIRTIECILCRYRQAVRRKRKTFSDTWIARVSLWGPP
jgi:hypothetical protein